MRKLLQNSILAGALSLGLLGGTVIAAQAPAGGAGGSQQPQQSRPSVDPNGPMANSTAGASSGSSKMDDKKFAKEAAMGGMLEVEFDKAYVKDMVKDHEKDVKDFQNESQNGTDPNVKQFATKTLPILQGHLESIKQLSKASSGT